MKNEFAQKVENHGWTTVSTTCDSGWVDSSDSKYLEYRMLIIGPPAIAGGTDRFQARVLTFQAKR
jgi:hypothetical protein